MRASAGGGGREKCLVFTNKEELCLIAQECSGDTGAAFALLRKKGGVAAPLLNAAHQPGQQLLSLIQVTSNSTPPVGGTLGQERASRMWDGIRLPAA